MLLHTPYVFLLRTIKTHDYNYFKRLEERIHISKSLFVSQYLTKISLFFFSKFKVHISTCRERERDGGDTELIGVCKQEWVWFCEFGRLCYCLAMSSYESTNHALPREHFPFQKYKRMDKIS